MGTPLPSAANTSSKIFTGSIYHAAVAARPGQIYEVLSIPGDSMVVIQEWARYPLPARGGSALAARTVSRTLNNVPIDRYVRITINA